MTEKPTPYDDLSATDVLTYVRRRGRSLQPSDLCNYFGCKEESAKSMLDTLAAIGEIHKHHDTFFPVRT